MSLKARVVRLKQTLTSIKKIKVILGTDSEVVDVPRELVFNIDIARKQEHE